MSSPAGLYYGDDKSVTVVVEKTPDAVTTESSGDLSGRKAESWTEQLSNWVSENEQDIVKAILVAIVVIGALTALGGYGCMMAAAKLKSTSLLGKGCLLFFSGGVVAIVSGAVLTWKKVHNA